MVIKVSLVSRSIIEANAFDGHKNIVRKRNLIQSKSIVLMLGASLIQLY